MATTPSLGPGQKPVTYCGYLPTETGLSLKVFPCQGTPGSPGNISGLNLRQKSIQHLCSFRERKKEEEKELSSRVGSSAFQLCGLREASNLPGASLICKVVMSVDAEYSYTEQWAVGPCGEGCDKSLPNVKPHTNVKWFYHPDDPYSNLWSVSLRPMCYVFLDKEATEVCFRCS